MATQNINNMSRTWSSGSTTYTAIKMNVTDAASAAASKLFDLQVEGVTKFDVRKDGVLGIKAMMLAPKGSDAASAATLTLGVDGNYFDVTGTTAITSIASVGVGTRILLQFDDALVLTHHATDLILPGAANITTAAGDHAEFVEYASGDWRCVSYTKASGEQITPVSYGIEQSLSTTEQAQARSNIIAGHALMGLRSVNALVNPFMQVSQQNGSDALTTSGGYGADQKEVLWSGAMGVSHGRKAASFTGVTVPFPFMYEINVTTADASLDAEDLLYFQERIEADRLGGQFQFGTANAVNALVAVYLETNYTGKVAVGLRNHNTTRSYVTDIDVVANTPALHIVEIPGDTTGTWLTTAGVRGAVLHLAMSVGSTYQATADTWSAGNYAATAATTNGAGTLNNRLRLLPIGMFPKRLGLTKAMLEGLSLADWMWLMQPYPLDADICRRYWQFVGEYARGIWISSSTVRLAQELATIMRTSPTATLTSSTPTVWKWAYTSHVGSGSTITTNASLERVLQVNMNGFSTSNALDDPAYMAANYIELSARM